MSAHVALVLLDIAELGGGGGAERFFADVHAAWTAQPRTTRLTLVTDARSAARLRAVGRAVAGDVVILPGAGRGAALRQARALGRWCDDARVQVVHVPLLAPQCLPWLWGVGRPRGSRRPLVTVTQVDANLARAWFEPSARVGREQWKSLLLHWLYFRTLRLDGVYTWYRSFAERSADIAPRGSPLVRAARYCFVDTARYAPAAAKSRRIVWAARMVEGKRPLLFVQALQWLLRRAPDALDGWRVDIYGAGALLDAVRSAVARAGLASRVAVHGGADLRPVLADSMIFVSTQDRENFTSLAMLEAMAAGNAIVAFDVGQTRMFVRPRANGALAAEVAPGALADALLGLLTAPEHCLALGRESRRITLEEHCAANFLADIEAFWLDVIGRAPHRRGAGAN